MVSLRVMIVVTTVTVFNHEARYHGCYFSSVALQKYFLDTFPTMMKNKLFIVNIQRLRHVYLTDIQEQLMRSFVLTRL